jgi:predicted nucleic acid-binding protein
MNHTPFNHVSQVDCYQKKGRPISFPDAWIAAAALQLNIPLVTHNARDYEAVDGLTILTATTVA